MAVSAKGKAPNHGGWLNRKKGRGLTALIKTNFFGDRDRTENTIWNDWLFGQAEVPPEPPTTSNQYLMMMGVG